MMSPDTTTDPLITFTSEDVPCIAHMPLTGKSVMFWLLGAQGARHCLGMYDTRDFQRSQEDKLLQTNMDPYLWDISLCGDTGHFAHKINTVRTSSP